MRRRAVFCAVNFQRSGAALCTILVRLETRSDRHADDGKRLRFLPLGVFTPPARQEQRKARYSAVVEEVKATLGQCGFQIHRNPTESLQIHCDYKA